MYVNSILLVFVLSFLTSCTKVENIESSKTKKPEPLFFKGSTPTKGVPLVYPTALFQGYLVQKGNCLFLSPKQNSDSGLYGIIWPWDYTLDYIGNKLIVKNGAQIKIATVGTYVKLGGGYSSAELNKTYKQCSAFKVKEIFGGYSLHDF